MVNVPPGHHTVEIEFVGTPPQRLGALLSAAGLLLICGLTLAGYFWPSTATKSLAATDGEEAERPESVVAQAAIARQGTGDATSPTFTGKASRRRKATLAIAALAVVSGLGIVLFSGQRRSSPNTLPPPTAAGNRSLRIGSDAKLSIGTAGEVTVAADPQSLSELIDAIARRDDQKLAGLLQSGKAFRVEQDVRVRLLNTSGGQVKVTILEGRGAGREGWVLEGWLK